jgi:hypothetical protein
VSELVQLDTASVEAVARRVVELLRDEGAIGTAGAGELLTAAEVARRHGVDRSWVYAHADELGALRLGDGPKPRLRFDPERVRDALDARSAGEGSRHGEGPAAMRVREVDLSGLVPNGLDSLPERWRDAAGASSRESTR